MSESLQPALELWGSTPPKGMTASRWRKTIKVMPGPVEFPREYYTLTPAELQLKYDLTPNDYRCIRLRQGYALRGRGKPKPALVPTPASEAEPQPDMLAIATWLQGDEFIDRLAARIVTRLIEGRGT